MNMLFALQDKNGLKYVYLLDNMEVKKYFKSFKDCITDPTKIKLTVFSNCNVVRSNFSWSSSLIRCCYSDQSTFIHLS